MLRKFSKDFDNIPIKNWLLTMFQNFKKLLVIKQPWLDLQTKNCVSPKMRYSIFQINDHNGRPSKFFRSKIKAVHFF